MMLSVQDPDQLVQRRRIVTAPTFTLAAFLLGLGGGLLLLAQFGFFEVWRQSIVGGDFSQFWVAARVFVSGGNPYDPATWGANVTRLGGQDATTPVFLYPAWVVFLIAPLGLFELPTAATIWLVGTLLFASVGLYRLLRARAPQLPLVHTLVGFTLVGSESGIVNFFSGQWSFFLIGALSFLSLFLYQGHAARAALAAGAMLIKPQLFVLAGPALLYLAIARGQRRIALLVVALTGAAIAASAVVLPRWWEPWSSVPRERAGNIRSASLPNAMRDTFGDGGFIVAIVLLLVLVGLALAYSPRSHAAWPVWLVVSLNVAPYVFAYDHVVLLVPVALAAAILGEHGQGWALLFTAACFVVLVIGGTLLHAFPSAQHHTLSYNGAVPFGIAVLVVGALWPHRFRPTMVAA
jgi:hypothetical protein